MLCTLCLHSHIQTLNRLRLQGLGHHQLREYTILLCASLASFPDEYELCTFLLYHSPDLCIHDISLLFAIDHTPHVSPPAIFQRGCSWGWPGSIAIWNRNKTVVALVIVVWVTNISFLIHGKSLFTGPVSELKPIHIWIVTRYHSGEESISKYFGSSVFIYPQMRSAWVPAQGACSVPDAENNKAAVISMFITDFFLLLVMLIGLLRMRHRGAGTFALGQLLWKQVRWKRLLHGRGTLFPLM